MSEKEKNLDFGPLKGLMGTWKGTKGLDIAPDSSPGGKEENLYYETIQIDPVGDLKNAESQTLIIVRYLQIVKRKLNDEVFHDETGYWIWNPSDDSIILSFSIPRAVTVLASGKYKMNESNELKINVSAKEDDPSWGILQSPFMKQKAKTLEFHREFFISGGKLKYHQETILNIYGKVFSHTDENELELVK